MEVILGDTQWHWWYWEAVPVSDYHIIVNRNYCSSKGEKTPGQSSARFMEFCYYRYILILCWLLSVLFLHEKKLIWCVLDMVSSWWWWWGFNRLEDIHLQYPASISIFIVKRERGCDSFLLLSSDSLPMMVWDPIYTAIRWNHFYKELAQGISFVEASKLPCNYIQYIHCPEEGGIGFYIHDDQEISLRPKSWGSREILWSEGM